MNRQVLFTQGPVTVMKWEKYRTLWQYRYLVVGEFERDRVEVPDDDGAVLAPSGQQLTVRRPLHNTTRDFNVQYRYRTTDLYSTVVFFILYRTSTFRKTIEITKITDKNACFFPATHPDSRLVYMFKTTKNNLLYIVTWLKSVVSFRLNAWPHAVSKKNLLENNKNFEVCWRWRFSGFGLFSKNMIRIFSGGPLSGSGPIGNAEPYR